MKIKLDPGAILPRRGTKGLIIFEKQSDSKRESG